MTIQPDYFLDVCRAVSLKQHYKRIAQVLLHFIFELTTFNRQITSRSDCCFAVGVILCPFAHSNIPEETIWGGEASLRRCLGTSWLQYLLEYWYALVRSGLSPTRPTPVGPRPEPCALEYSDAAKSATSGSLACNNARAVSEGTVRPYHVGPGCANDQLTPEKYKKTSSWMEEKRIAGKYLNL